jgi:hypothetical protein
VAEAMNGSGNEELAQALRHAKQEGELCPPTKLIALIDGFEAPLMALQNYDQASQLFDAFHQEFGFIRWSFAKESQSVNSPFARPMDFSPLCFLAPLAPQGVPRVAVGERSQVR